MDVHLWQEGLEEISDASLAAAAAAFIVLLAAVLRVLPVSSTPPKAAAAAHAAVDTDSVDTDSSVWDATDPDHPGSASLLGTESREWWNVPPVSAAEALVIGGAIPLLHASAPAGMLGRAHSAGAAALKMELLRKLRTLSARHQTSEHLAALINSASDWKRRHCAAPPCAPLASASDLDEGEWATRFLVLGIRCGTSRGGHHVKIERTGAHDMAALVREPDGEAKLRAFYTVVLAPPTAHSPLLPPPSRQPRR